MITTQRQPGRPAGAPDFGSFTACSLCARMEPDCTGAEHVYTPQTFSGRYALPIAVFTPTMQRALNRPARGARTPVTIRATATATGWHVEAKRDGELFGFTAELHFCNCEDSIPCAKPRCGKTRGRDGHCHGNMNGGKHIEHVRAFVAEVASAYAGKVTVAPIPDLRWGVNEHGKSVIVPLAICA